MSSGSRLYGFTSLVCLIFCIALTQSVAIDLTSSVVVLPPAHGSEETRLGRWLVKEVNSRLPNPNNNCAFWTIVESKSDSVADCVRSQGHNAQVVLEIAESSHSHRVSATGNSHVVSPPESGSFAIRADDLTQTVRIVAPDTRGLQAGVGRLLREMRMPGRPGTYAGDTASTVSLPSIHIVHDSTTELWKLRGHQIPTTHHPYQFRTLEEFQEFAFDLAAFGTNRLELGHVKIPLNVDELVNFSQACARAGLSVAVWGGGDTWSQNYSTSVEVNALPCTNASDPNRRLLRVCNVMVLV
mgnify:FL=1